jgi:type I restriction enzyme M protein
MNTRDPVIPRPESLEFLPHPARRRRGLRRLPGAAHLPAVPEAGARIRKEPYNRDTHIPKGYDWASLTLQGGRAAGGALPGHAAQAGAGAGHAGRHLLQGQNKIQDPAKLSRLVQLIDAESWISLDADTKGDLYEGLLQKNAEDTKSGAGQYFTPRALIEAMVACVRPEPMKPLPTRPAAPAAFFWAPTTG